MKVDPNIPAIPVADSMKAVTGLVPMRAPIEMEKASTQYAIVEFSKSRVTGSRSPANLAMEYRVPVVSTRSVSVNVKFKVYHTAYPKYQHRGK